MICKAGLLALALSAGSASAAQIYWTDWTGGDLDSGNGFRGVGTITTSNATVTVTYTNPQGIAFYQPSGGAYYYSNGTDGPAGTSPYTSSAVDNRPGTTDIIALRYAGLQTLSFSQAIANPVFAYVSLNGNGYGFDQDF
ncbi:MAG: PEP-CTERM sorting domain-containing protein, partial [Thauera sp.]|nr:PEP-CTERM sorting domain-containing protein [Thauera sp.]